MSEIKTHIDLFSGIGGFALAARWAGIKTVQFVEIDKFCQQVLQKNFPGVPIHDNIKTFANAQCLGWGKHQGIPQKNTTDMGQHIESTSKNINSPFLLTGGFPCQPFSCAGKRRGKEDDRYLWEEMLRVIETLKPTWIIGENVAGINSMEFTDSIPDVEGETDSQEDGNENYTNVLDGICDSLEAIGYEVQPVIIPACAVNAPHRRDRVWIVAHSNNHRWPGNGDKVGCWKGRKQTGVMDIHKKQGRIEIWGEHERSGASAWSKPWLEAATRLCRMDDGVSEELYKLETSDRVGRLKALGNAIVPQVAYEIMKAIIKSN